jgi:hypothetical protein
LDIGIRCYMQRGYTDTKFDYSIAETDKICKLETNNEVSAKRISKSLLSGAKIPLMGTNIRNIRVQ